MDSRPLDEWKWENDESMLRTALLAGLSYPEYAVIVHRLRELTGKTNATISWSRQALDDAFERDLVEHRGQPRAIFTHGSPFKDGLLYAEHKPLWWSAVDQAWSLPSTAPQGLAKGLWKRVANRRTELTPESDLADVRRAWNDLTKELELETDDLSDEQARALVEGLQQRVRFAGWKKNKRASFACFAQIDGKQDEAELIELLLERGATITDNQLGLNDYQYSGKRFTIALAGGRFVHYVPHGSVGVKELERWRHRLRWRGGAEALEAIRERILESFAAHRIEPDDVFLSTDHYDRIGLLPRALLLQKNRLRPKALEELSAAAESGAVLRQGERGRWARHTTIEAATHEHVRRFPDYYIDLGDGGYMYHHAAKARDRLLASASALAEITLEVGFESEFEEAPQLGVGAAAETNARAFRKALRAQLPKLTASLGDEQLAKDAINILGIAGVEAYFEQRAEGVTRREQQVHDAPFSERGVFRIEHVAPAEAMEILQELGVISGLCEEVPYDTIYRGRHRRGRVLPWHPDYALGSAKLPLPDGHAILHGLTGISGDEKSIIDRVQKIIETGGLKSIAERRRMGLNVGNTMSPIGDTSSGIDVGVPTRISSVNCPGHGAYFIMKPSCILRRDVFFANQDYGGGGERESSYNAYAKSIGQGKMHHVASHAARSKHLKTGLGPGNELYLAHEIPWDEVTAIAVMQVAYKGVKALVEAAQARGDIPASLQVVAVQNGSLTSTIKSVFADEKGAVQAV
jgi:hypothetical protein